MLSYANYSFTSEAIINFTKIQNDQLLDKNTGNKSLEPKFTCLLYFTKEGYNKFSKHITAISKTKEVNISLKKIKEALNGDVKEKTRAVIMDNLPKEYIYQQSAKSFLKFMICSDCYGVKLDPKNIKSGDKVYVKATYIVTLYNGKKHLSLFINAISKVKEGFCELFDAESLNEDFYDGLKQYQEFSGEPDNDDENDENDEKEPWER